MSTELTRVTAALEALGDDATAEQIAEVMHGYSKRDIVAAIFSLTDGGGDGGSQPLIRWGYDRLIYQRDAGDDASVWHVGADGLGSLRITPAASGFYDYIASFEPSERRLVVFTHYRNSDGLCRVCTIDPDDPATLVDLTDDLDEAISASNGVFSPDGTLIYYAAGGLVGPPPSSLWTMNRDGTDKTEIIVNPDWSVGPDFPVSFSPDGERFVVGVDNTDDPDDEGLYVYNADGTGGTQILQKNSNGYSIWDCAWGKGDVIAFTQQTAVPDGDEVFLINPDGTGLTAITSDAGTPQWYTLAWAPDGSRLIVANDAPAVVVMDIDGSHVPLVADTDGARPRWGVATDNAHWSSLGVTA